MHEEQTAHQNGSLLRCPIHTSYGSDEIEDDSKRKEKRKNLSFGHVVVRHYDRTVSDNPSVSSGCAIGLDWKFSKTEIYKSTHDFEEKIRKTSRKLQELKLDRKKREAILKDDWGIPKSKLASTIRGINAAKSRRLQTQNNLKFSGLEERCQGAVKKLKKILRLRKSTQEEIDSLWKQAASLEHSRKSYKKRAEKRCTSMSTLRFSIHSEDGELGLQQSLHKPTDQS